MAPVAAAVSAADGCTATLNEPPFNANVVAVSPVAAEAGTAAANTNPAAAATTPAPVENFLIMLSRRSER